MKGTAALMLLGTVGALLAGLPRGKWPRHGVSQVLT